LTLGNRNTVSLIEVIRVLGPFPNVKNTLEGSCAVKRLSSPSALNDDGGVVDWTITWTSMIDGTGKQHLAGAEQNTRVVNLHVCFSDPSIVVAVVPPNSDDPAVRRPDPLEENGKHVLLFVKEPELEDKLDSLRVI